MEKTHKARSCAYRHCRCPVGEGERFCSAYCAIADSVGDASGLGCQCNHPPCNAAEILARPDSRVAPSATSLNGMPKGHGH